MKRKQREIIYTNRDVLLVGLDEAGRGCLAGPVVAAAVAFPEDLDLVGLADSKTLNQKAREELAEEIKSLSLAWGVGLASVNYIYEHNILQASLMAMLRAYIAMQKKVKIEAKILVIDGNQLIPDNYFKQYGIMELEQRAIVDGDATVPVISAASILAKTFRDELMNRYARIYPDYNFAAHKGYGTKEHIAAIKEFGTCKIHRRKFKQVRLEPVNKYVQTSLI